MPIRLTGPDHGTRVAYLCLEAPREGQASYVHVHEIVAGLRARGHAVDIVAPGYSGRWTRPGIVRRGAEYLWLQLRLALRLRRYRLVYVRAHPMAFPLALAARLLGVKAVHEVNGTWEDLYIAHPGARRWRGALDALQRAQYRWAAGLIAVTPLLADWLKRVTAPLTPPLRVIPNGANVALFTPGVASARELPAKFAVFFGGLTRWHGIDTMLAALASPAWPKDVALVVVGDGPEAARLRAVAAAEPRLVPLGRLPYAEVPGVVARAIAGLVPVGDPGGRSSAIGLAPLKLFETLACAVPAVVTDLPFQAELVREHGCGLVIPVDDGTALAQAVAQLAADPAAARAMGARGRAHVVAEHSWERRAADTAAFLEALR